MKHCPALFIAAPASGQGKTTVTAALARYHRNQGRKVRVFKTGPDFLDPMILECASDAPVYQLDMWMGGEDHCRQLLYEAASDADLILIEGVMGLFDGQYSSADLAMLFDIPVLAVIDGSAMAQTFGAVAHGLATYRAGLRFAGVLANRVAGERHYHMLAESLPPGLVAWGWLGRDADIALPERHLGLVQAAEVHDLEARITRAAAALKGMPGMPDTNAHVARVAGGNPANEKNRQTDGGIPSWQGSLPSPVAFVAPAHTGKGGADAKRETITRVSGWQESLPAPVAFTAPAHTSVAPLLSGVHIAVARDDAFAFLYRANLELLAAQGATLVFFSPLDDSSLPPADALYLPGGYPELHLERLAANETMKAAIRAHHAAGRPIVAECGGMLYLLQSLTDAQGRCAAMAGLLPGDATLQDKLANLGLHGIELPEGALRGHTFHYSRMESPLMPIAWSEGARPGRRGEPAYRAGRLHASYLHLYFPSNPAAAARLFAPYGINA